MKTGVVFWAKRNHLLIFILTLGVFGILNTEMGVIGILPSLADHYKISVTQAGLLVSLFALVIGNIVTGKLLTYSASKSVMLFPLLLGAVYIILFLTGQFTVPVAIITFIWGILAGGLMANINQYLIASSAPEAPDFANGLFISSCNVGTTVGAAVGGLFISGMGIQYVVLVGILSLIVSLVTILFRNYMSTPLKKFSG